VRTAYLSRGDEAHGYRSRERERERESERQTVQGSKSSFQGITHTVLIM